MKLAAIIGLFLCTLQVFSQEKFVRFDEKCSARGTVATGQPLGTVRDLKILLVQFTDVHCRMDSGGVSPRYSVSDFENLLGSEGVYVSPGMYSPDGDEVFGSMNDYYINMSGGRLRIHAHVINRTDSLHGKPVWVTLGQTKQYYHKSLYAIFNDAADAASSAGLDPSTPDNTSLAIIYAGNTYWLNMGLNPVTSAPSYIMSELQGRDYNQENPDARFARIGVHCHEFGHTIGIDHCTSGRADLMNGGFWNGSVEGNAPAPLSAIVRARYGWANVIPVESVASEGIDASYSLTNPAIYLMKNSQGDQFYIENRRFDQTMTIGGTSVPDYNNVRFFPPAGPHHAITQGIFVWRVNTISLLVEDMGYATNGLLYASGRYGRTFPENEVSDTDDGVPFPGVSNKRLLTPWSDPRNPYSFELDPLGLRSPYRCLFVPNTKGGRTCGMEVVSEDRAGGTFRIKFYTSNPPNPALAHLPIADSIGSYDSRRTIVREDSGMVHQAVDLGGEIFYRRSTDNGQSWSVPSLISLGRGGNSAPCLTRAGAALLVAWQMDAYDRLDYDPVQVQRGINLSRSTDAGMSWSAYRNVGMSIHSSAPGAYPSLTGAKDGSVMLVYRSDSLSLVSEVSPDAGITWSGASPVPVGDISWTSPSLAIKDPVAGALIAYAGESVLGTSQVMYDRFAFGSGAWGTPGTVSGIVTQQFTGFRNPDVVPAAQGASSLLNVAWDATDTYSGVPVIISRSVDNSHLGSTYTVFKGISQNDLSAVQFPRAFSGNSARSYARVLTMMDSVSGASISIEIGLITLVHKGGKADTIRLADSPPDSLILDVAGLIGAGNSSAFAPGSDTDTLQIVEAIFGHNPGTLFVDGHAGFEIVHKGSNAVIGQFGVESASSITNGSRRLILISIPASSLPPPGNGQTIVLRPFVAGLRVDARITAILAHVYSYVSENPVDRILTGAGGDASHASAPVSFALEQNYPNPFNPATTIRFALGRMSHVTLMVYNTLGQEVATLVHGDLDAGTHEVRFEGGKLASGMYIYTLRAGNNVATKKFILLR